MPTDGRDDIQRMIIDELPRSPLVDYIGSDLALFRDVNDFPFPPYPLRVSALCLAVCRSGSARLRINLDEYDVAAGTMVVVHPDMIVQRVSGTDDLSASLVLVSKEYAIEFIPTAQQLYPLTLWARERPCVAITADEQAVLTGYHDFMRSRLRRGEGPFVRQVARGLLTALYYEVYTVYKRIFAEREARPEGRKQEVFEGFMRAVTEQCRVERSVEHYADRLCLSPKYLSTVVREVSGRTAGAWIADFVILEAKALLKSTDKSIQQIAEELHFANQSFFGRYFKQHTGLSPKAYRAE